MEEMKEYTLERMDQDMMIGTREIPPHILNGTTNMIPKKKKRKKKNKKTTTPK